MLLFGKRNARTHHTKHNEERERGERHHRFIFISSVVSTRHVIKHHLVARVFPQSNLLSRETKKSSTTTPYHSSEAPLAHTALVVVVGIDVGVSVAGLLWYRPVVASVQRWEAFHRPYRFQRDVPPARFVHERSVGRHRGMAVPRRLPCLCVETSLARPCA